MEQLAGVYEALWSCGEAHGLQNVGIHALDSLRLEKTYRAWKQDLEIGYSPLAAGLQRFVDCRKPAFPGRTALLREQQEGPRQRLVGLTVDAEETYLMPLASLFAGGRRVGLVTSAGVGHRVRRPLALAYIAAELAEDGTAVEVAHFGSRLSAQVCLRPFYDPDNERLRA
jgi:dimethylglycine dehydrogenase